MSGKRDRDDQLKAFTNDLAPAVRRGGGLSGMLGSGVSTPTERGTDTVLSVSELDVLMQYEVIIERGLKTFFEVGNALVHIRDLELYRADFPSFESYCAARWGISRPRAYELMNAAQVVSAIADSQWASSGTLTPQNEAQVRPLTRLKDPALQREAWQQAVATAPDGRITAAHVAQVVQQFLREAEPAPSSTPAPPATVIDVRPLDAIEPPTLAAVQARNAELEQRLATVQAILAEYQAQIAQAQAYPPDSAQGGAVAPLLQALEQVQRELATHAWSARDPKGVP